MINIYKKDKRLKEQKSGILLDHCFLISEILIVTGWYPYFLLTSVATKNIIVGF